MVSAPGKVAADDVTLRVGTEGQGVHGSWWVDRREGALPEQKAVPRGSDLADLVEADDVPLRVDAARLGS